MASNVWVDHTSSSRERVPENCLSNANYEKSWLPSWLATALIPKPSPTSPSIAPTSNPSNQQKKRRWRKYAPTSHNLWAVKYSPTWGEEKSWKKFSSRNRQPTHTRSPRRETTTRESLFAFFRTYSARKKMLVKKNFLFPLCPDDFFSLLAFPSLSGVSKIRKNVCAYVK